MFRFYDQLLQSTNLDIFLGFLAQRWYHKGVCVYSLHPGNMVSSNLTRNYWFYRIVFAIVRPFTKSLVWNILSISYKAGLIHFVFFFQQQAASTSVYCATALELTGITGQYYNNCFFCEPSKRAQNDEMADGLWAESETIVKKILSNHGGNCEITI